MPSEKQPQELDPQTVQRFYNRTQGPPWDRWHDHQSSELARFLAQVPDRPGHYLNLGSGGTPDLGSRRHINIDVALRPLRAMHRAVLASAESLPFGPAQFSTVICVGSVLNYCDAARLLFEASRVLAPRGLFVLEYERSDSIEYLGTSHYRRAATLARVALQGAEHLLWLYSDSYVSQLLRTAGLRIVRRRYFHVASAIAHRFLEDQERSAAWAAWDFALAGVPLLRGLASNVILSCERA
jgi:SAM-dependent methyltransferase